MENKKENYGIKARYGKRGVKVKWGREKGHIARAPFLTIRTKNTGGIKRLVGKMYHHGRVQQGSH